MEIEHKNNKKDRIPDFCIFIFDHRFFAMHLYSTYTDQQLLNLLHNDDQSAFTELYDRYWQRMFAMAFLRLERRDLAEDIVQDIFTRLWQKRHKLSITALEPWLATAVKYQVIDLVHRRLKKELCTEQLPERPESTNPLDIRFFEQQLAAEINTLPDKCRLVFLYRYQHGLSNRAIATELSISEKAVEKHITTARKRLALSLRSLLHSLFSFL